MVVQSIEIISSFHNHIIISVMAPSSDANVTNQADNVSQLLEEVFEASTQEADLTDLIGTVSDLYDAFSGQGFESSFKEILKTVLSENKRSVEVRRILCFISECAVTMDNKFKNDHQAHEESTEDIDDIIHPLLKYLFKALARWSNAASYTIRFRSCQLLHMILTYVQDHGVGEIDMATYENISKIIDTRKLDVSCNVRAHAVLLAKFFQDPSSVNDPVIAGLCWQLESDPNPRVRQNIVSIIAACEETIVPITKRFLFDKNAAVRNAALLHICNRISPRSFSTKQRIMILKQCFSDPSELVRRNAEERLIPVWFRAYKDKLCRFFKDLRLGSESLDNLMFISKFLKVLSKCVKIAQIVEEIDLDLESCLPKSNLTADKVFLWHRFYLLGYKEEKLCKFLPQPEVLIDFISKQFTSSAFEDDQSSIFNELSLFAMQVIADAGADKCEEIFPVILNMMRNPYVAHDVMPYIVTLYMTYAPKEKSIIYGEIMQAIEDLQKLIQFTPGEEKNIVLKSLSIVSQVFLEADTLTNELKSMKDNLIVHHLSSEDLTLKKKSLSALALYCKLDKEEAIASWSLFTNAAFIASSDLKNILLKGAFDILNCHGLDIFSDCEEEQLDSTLESLLLNLEDDDKERSIMVLGILKLYLCHYTFSPNILAKLILLYFNPESYSTMKDIETFLKLYGKTKQEAECLCQTYLTVIDLLFDSNKHGPYHKINVKKVTLQLLEFGKSFENSKSSVLEENFEDLVILKITKKFLKTPWRLQSADLYTICNLITPKNVDNLIKLKENIKLVIESMNSAVYQQTNPFTKKSTKQFSAYMKKIQNAINTAPLVFEAPKQPSPLEKRLFADPPTDESIDSSKDIEIEVDASPPLRASLDETGNNSEKSPDSDSSLPGTPEKSFRSQDVSATFKTPAPPTKTPASRKAPASKNTPAPTKTPAPRKTPASGMASSTRKTPGTAKSRTARKKVPDQVQLSVDQSEFCIENVDSN
ncbi:hypothetical protein JTE90_027302 [Oedothorax gibbosus]|uniref:Nuclear condensin complex subunit 3 C-terminal domain-containing protein n=1 Tax=Oedothorax gibbosus TaxID=931172 RepID=A0AAV6VXT6_9ARAC|nr:hypothetical protein JTE90_027302 [Oedothorax gibbosus]